MTEKSDGYDDWDMKIAEWRGNVLASIEAMNREITQLREDIKCTNTKIDNLNFRLTTVQIKIAAIGGTAGIITSLVLWLVTRI